MSVVARRPFISIVPTRRLALAVAVLGVLWLLPDPWEWRGFGIGLVLLVGALVVDVMLLPGRADVAVERRLPPSVGIGDPVEGEYALVSRWGRRVEAELFDSFPPAVTGGVGAASARLARGGEATIPFTARGMVRGRFALGPVAVRARGALGLVARRSVHELDDAVLVTPSIAGVRRFRLLALQDRLQAVGVRALRRRGEGRAFAGLREYTLGDDPRHIDWKATAKRGKVITREFTIEQSQTVITLVDAGRSMTQLAGAFPRFEHALSSALILTDVATTAGDLVGTLVFDDEVRAYVPPQRGGAALRAVRDALIPVTATLAEPDYATAFRVLATRQRKRALIVFFTDVMDVRASRSLVAQLARGAQRHLVVVVALRNDALFAAAEPHAERAPALYESAVAEELIAAREEVLERMRRVGVTVLDVSPSAMTAAVVNRYLEIKGRGAL